MRALIVDKSDQDRWDDFVAHSELFGLLQSWQWGEFKEKMGWEVVRIACEDDGYLTCVAQLFIKPIAGKHASIAYIPRGPIVDWSDESSINCLLSEIHKQAKQNHAIFLKIEPPLLNSNENSEQLLNHKFRSSKITNQPKNTIILDIRHDSEVILAGMRQKTRQYIKRATREGISVRIGTESDLPTYIALMKATGKRQGFSTRGSLFYEKEYEYLAKHDEYILLIAERNGEVIAVRTICAIGQHAAEFHAGSIEDIDNLHPNYLLVWEGIQWAKRKGCVTYDLWGIPDELKARNEEISNTKKARNDGLWGVYQFKRGFSQNIVSFVGAYDYVYSKIPYAFYSLPIFNRDNVEKISTLIDPRKMTRAHTI